MEKKAETEKPKHKYYFIWVGGEASVYLMAILLGHTKIDEGADFVEAESIRKAIGQYEMTAEYADSLYDYNTEDLTQIIWSGGHEGYIVIRHDVQGMLKK